MQKTNTSLVHPVVDFLMLGGLSIATYLLFLIVNFKDLSKQMAMTAFVLAFLINFPHFMASYQLLYIDYRKKIFSNFMWILISIVIPVILFINIAILYNLKSVHGYAVLIRLMFFLVGWHYVKQTMGVMIVLGAREKYYLSSFQKNLLKINLLSIWCVSFVSANVQKQSLFYFNLPYTSFEWSKFYVDIAYGSVLLWTAFFIYVTILRFYKTREKPPWILFLPYVSLFLWLLPLFDGTDFFLFIPLFHSLQYLLVVYALKKNQFHFFKNAPKALAQMPVSLFFLISVFLGAIFMDTLPRLLDLSITLPSTDYELMMAGFLIFINIHHYFIDHIIWKKDVLEVQYNLFGG